MLACVAALTSAGAAAAADQAGRVTFSDLPVPGATVTIRQGDASKTTVTDDDGVFRFTDLADGAWTLQVEMVGFAAAARDIVVAGDGEPQSVALTLLSFDEIAGGRSTSTGPGAAMPAASAAAQAPAQPPARGAAGFQRATVNASTPPAARADAAAVGGAAGGDASADRSVDAADGFLINGSVNNAAASPFAQLPAFGNNRRGAGSLYNGGFSLLLGNSAWGARPVSFSGQPAPRPDYLDAQIGAQFAGPVKLPGLRNRANLFLGYQHTANHDATTQSAVVPTEAERGGDFSHSVDALGRPLRPVDPLTGAPFPGDAIPAARLSPQARALLRFYPAPNVDSGRYDFQAPVVVATRQDALQSRLIEPLDARNSIYGNASWQRTQTDSGSIFGFVDTNTVSGIDAPINWSHRVSQFVSFRLRYQFTSLATNSTPYFANRENVSAEAGIAGNNQDPVNYGPPALLFSSGVATLSTAQYTSNADRTHAAGAEALLNHGRHNLTIGGDYRYRLLDVVGQENARGTFAFTGASSGSDVADFLLGLPHTSSIAFGNADKNLRARAADAYVTDDWRLGPSFTANIGLRWEFESPFSEELGRLANLEVAPGFTAVRAATSRDGGLHADLRGFQPRLGVAWRPVPGSSLIVRGGYGIYRNTAVYQSLTLLLAQQPPLSTTFSVDNNAVHPFTLANGFVAPAAGGGANTFAVDPNLRVGYAHNWQLLVQRDLPGSLTITTTYLGTRGSHLMQEFLPNTYPIGAANPCPACPAGFVYLGSDGSSLRNAGQVQLRRRLRNGFTATAQYTLAKATDDAAAAFTGVGVTGAAIAQDWSNLDAERAPSTFDQRHQLTAQVQYTSGVGVGGGTLLDGVRGSLLKGWTMASQLTVGSGLPLTPIYLTSVPGTGVTGSIRGDVVGATDATPPGSYANPAAFAAPLGHWGTAWRNSIRGPAQFALNASIGRSFLWGPRLTLDWRIDATNALNVVTYTGVSAFVGSPQFGLPIQANAMRKLQSSLRVRF